MTGSRRKTFSSIALLVWFRYWSKIEIYWECLRPYIGFCHPLLGRYTACWPSRPSSVCYFRPVYIIKHTRGFEGNRALSVLENTLDSATQQQPLLKDNWSTLSDLFMAGSGRQKAPSPNYLSYQQALLCCKKFLCLLITAKKHHHPIRITASTREDLV